MRRIKKKLKIRSKKWNKLIGVRALLKSKFCRWKFKLKNNVVAGRLFKKHQARAVQPLFLPRLVCSKHLKSVLSSKMVGFLAYKQDLVKFLRVHVGQRPVNCYEKIWVASGLEGAKRPRQKKKKFKFAPEKLAKTFTYYYQRRRVIGEKRWVNMNL